MVALLLYSDTCQDAAYCMLGFYHMVSARTEDLDFGPSRREDTSWMYYFFLAKR